MSHVQIMIVLADTQDFVYEKKSNIDGVIKMQL